MSFQWAEPELRAPDTAPAKSSLLDRYGKPVGDASSPSLELELRTSRALLAVVQRGLALAIREMGRVGKS